MGILVSSWHCTFYNCPFITKFGIESMALLLHGLYFIKSSILSICLQGQLLLLIIGLKFNTNKNVLLVVNSDVIFWKNFFFLLSRLCLVSWSVWFHLLWIYTFLFIKGKYRNCNHSFLPTVFVNVCLQQKKFFLRGSSLSWFSLHSFFRVIHLSFCAAGHQGEMSSPALRSGSGLFSWHRPGILNWVSDRFCIWQLRKGDWHALTWGKGAAR